MSLTANPGPGRIFACHACPATAPTLLEATRHIRSMVAQAPTPTRHAMLDIEEDADRDRGWASRARRIVYYDDGEAVVDAMRWDPYYRSVRPDRAIAIDKADRARRGHRYAVEA